MRPISDTWLARTRTCFDIISLCLLLQSAPARAQIRAERGAELDQLVAKEARLEWMVELARLQNPALHAARDEARAASELRAASGFPDPELKYEQWAVPLSRPYALNRADTLMFGARQALPAPGLVRDRERIAEEDAQIASQAGRDLERELLFRVRSAYYAYYASERTLEVHVEHVGLVEQIQHQLRADYEVGRGDQQGLLQLTVELSRLHNDLADTRQQRASSRLLLNALMSRTPDAALGPPAELATSPPQVAPEKLAGELEQSRPDLIAAAQRVRRSQGSVALAAHSARRPAFMVGADYWYMPMADTTHAYGAMVSMTLPWLNPRHRAELRAAERRLQAERHRLEAASERARYELHDAAAKVEAAAEALRILEDDLLPQAQRSLDAARASFAIGGARLVSLLESLRSYFEVRRQHSRARARALSALAELEFAAGVAREPAPPTPPVAPGVSP